MQKGISRPKQLMNLNFTIKNLPLGLHLARHSFSLLNRFLVPPKPPYINCSHTSVLALKVHLGNAPAQDIRLKLTAGK